MLLIARAIRPLPRLDIGQEAAFVEPDVLVDACLDAGVGEGNGGNGAGPGGNGEVVFGGGVLGEQSLELALGCGEG